MIIGMEIDQIKQAARERMDELLPYYEEYVTLRKMLAERSVSTSSDPNNDVGKFVVQAVLANGDEPMTPGQVRSLLDNDGHGFTRDQVNNALHYAVRKGTISRSGRGRYCAS